ncbi:MAG TPA: hypothetical protein VLC09_13195 [Polyangiaceae bacterium]|nr:hypothetical protein [Polyangiaceae bacterium]
MRARLFASSLVVLALGLIVVPTSAEEVPTAAPSPSKTTERAAPTPAPNEDAEAAHSAFDEGVQHFRDAKYDAAARAFLRADALSPSSDSLANALVAAERAGSHLLIALIAERAISREGADPGLVTQARKALAQAARHLGRLELTCEPTPCEVLIDGAKMEAGAHYLAPGTHELSARSSSVAATAAARTAELDAGSSYRIVLSLPANGPRSRPNEPAAEASYSTASNAALWAGVGVTAILTGVTIGSGIDSLSYRNSYGETVPDEVHDELASKVQRTDVLLACSIGSAVATLGWALFRPGPGEAVTTGGARPAVALVPLPDGLWLSARGTLP